MQYLLNEVSSERLFFRKVMPSDFKLWLPFHEDPDSSKYWDGIDKDPKMACKLQFDRIFERYDNDLGGMNALISKTTNEFIGLCGLLVQQVNYTEELEIGYSILPKFWGNGYASEAAQICKKQAFTNNWASSLISIIQIHNIPSQKVAIKNGMKKDITTTYHDNPVYIYRIEKEDFLGEF